MHCGPHSDVKVHKSPGQYNYFLQGIEEFAVEKLVPYLGIEAFTIPVFPRTARFDINRSYAEILQPLFKQCGRKLAAVVTTDIGRAAFEYEQSSYTGLLFRFASISTENSLWT